MVSLRKSLRASVFLRLYPFGVTHLHANLLPLKTVDNAIQGQIPTEIGQLVELSYLDVAYNDLTGSLPTEIGAISQLTYVDICK